MYEQYGNYGGYVPNQAMGVYGAYNQFDLDPTMLTSLGFNMMEIQTLQFIVQNGGKVSPSALCNYGLDYESAKRLKYMYDIASGKVIIESTNDLVKHLRRMFGGHRRIGINDLALSKVSKVPRLAVVGGIPKGVYALYNSKNYVLTERMYEVTDISGRRVTIKTSRRPVLPYGSEKKIYTVTDLENNTTTFALSKDEINSYAKSDSRYKIGVALEIKEVTQDKQVIISVDKDYARIVNRYIVVGSLRRPEFHLGLIEIICIEGTKVYVYATNMNKGDTVSYRGGTQRVYAYGYMPGEIKGKITTAATEIYRLLCGVFATEIPATADFRLLDAEQPTDDEEIIEQSKMEF